jgi:hypothetical protein
VVTGVATGAATGVAAGGAGGVTAGVVLVVVGGVVAGGVVAGGVVAGGVVAGGVVAGGVLGGVEPGLETRRECFGGLVAFASPIERTALSLVAWSITLVSTLTTPDKCEPEACFDELD